MTLHRVGSRVEVAAACPLAQALGLHTGMAATQARAMVKELDIRDAELEADAAFLARLGLFAARRWTPRAAVSGADGLWLDLTGVTHLFGGERRMAERLLAFCARMGFAARIAVAGTPGAAHALARYGHTAISLCPAGAEAEALAPLPLDALRLDARALATAQRLGIERIGELVAMPRGPLNRRFGPDLLTRLDQALGRVGEPFEPIVPEEPPSALLRLLEPVSTPEAIAQVASDLMDRLVATLERRGLAGRTYALIATRVDGAEQRIVIGTARPTRDGPHLLRLLGMKLDRIEPGFGIEAMRLVAGRCEPLAPQPIDSALGGARPAPDLAPLVDRLASRIGARGLFRSTALDSDLPERSVARIPPLDSPRDWPDKWPRPPRLILPPERIENVVALLPDQPPRRFSWRGKAHAVARADGPERVYGEWWRRAGEAEVVRDYFQVEDEEGARFWIYRRGDGVDPRTGDLSWWLQGAFG